MTPRSGFTRRQTLAGMSLACGWAGLLGLAPPAQARGPQVVAEGQGGLLDVVPDPRFASNRLVYWSCSESSASGMDFLTSERYPGWKGNLFIGALRGQALIRIELDGQRVLKLLP
jgi:glucose/arabinose dehydrogenase